MANGSVECGVARLRPDVAVMPDGETGRGRIVKDPRTKRYFQFDELEGFILDRLDGTHTAVDVQIALAEQFGEAFSLEELQDFVDTLKEKGLVEDDRPMLPVHAPALAAQVVTVLESQGVALPAGSAGGAARDEAMKFEEAVGFLRSGRFAAALRSFDELIAAHPNHPRAAALRAMLVQVGGAAALAEAQTQQGGRKQQSALYYRVPLFDPDEFLGRLEPLLRFVWTKGFAAAYAAVVAAAACVLAVHHVEMFTRLPALPGAAAIGAIVVAAILQIALHESAHGLTCKHFGGKVNETGFLLIFFFMPALYVDVSDAWVFRQRRQRVAVTLAGPLLDLFVACSAILAWRVLAPGYGRVGALAIMTTAATNLLINLNPLMKLDGYYLLSDLSGIPNLRAAASRAAGRILGRRDEAPMPARTRRFLFVYGVLSAVYGVFLLFVLGRAVLALSATLAGLWGPALLAVGLVWMTRRLWLALLRGVAGFVASFTWTRAITVGAAACTLLALLVLPLPLRVGGAAALEPAVRGAVRSSMNGNIVEVLVREGDRVEAGQVVARIDTRDLEAQLGIVRAAIARSEAELRLVAGGPQREVVAQAQERVQAARAEVEQIRARHERLSRLRVEGLVAADLHDQSRKELAISEGALRSATQETRLVEKGARPELVAAAAADLRRITAEAEEIERRIAACSLVAPAAGIVVTPNLDQRRGDFVAAGGTVFEIADTGSLVAYVQLLESEIGDVTAGAAVQLRFAAFPDRAFRGNVEEISPSARADALGRAFFRVRCRVEDGTGALRPGMTGAAKIDCGRRTAAQLALRRVLRMIDPSLL